MTVVNAIILSAKKKCCVDILRNVFKMSVTGKQTAISEMQNSPNLYATCKSYF